MNEESILEREYILLLRIGFLIILHFGDFFNEEESVGCWWIEPLSLGGVREKICLKNFLPQRYANESRFVYFKKRNEIVPEQEFQAANSIVQYT